MPEKAGKKLYYSKNGGQTRSSVTVGSDGKFSFTLKHGESIEFYGDLKPGDAGGCLRDREGRTRGRAPGGARFFKRCAGHGALPFGSLPAAGSVGKK